MASIVLPSRGHCIQITDYSQPCQCLWFFPPEFPLLDPLGSHSPPLDICGQCEHGIHAHADYVSTVVNNHPTNQCAAYAQKTRLTQFCTCGAHVFQHVSTYNPYYIPEPWTVLHYFNLDDNAASSSAATSGYSNDASILFSQNTTLFSNYSAPVLSNNATGIPFTPAYMPPPSPDINSSYLYGDTAILTPIPQPVVQLAIRQIEANTHSRSEMENSSSVQDQHVDGYFSVNVQDSHARFHQDDPYWPVHST
ncbi:hypothetical protein EDD18DRAFT_1457646 [Armillaria luteobubalina]|uniref:Uncharacterized protein n=1 Tax=Armillaria luteobubalina TaxID=153913 RepID=A0AA39QH16_9AGAR|nr:hypothetical protein EDD18DRAFT_1457646 [Armillaria luteobubalina]